MTDDISTLLERAFLNHQSRLGHRITLKEFAIYLDVPPPLLSMWLKGSRKPGPAYIEKLANVLGPEIYDSLGLPRPDPVLQYIAANWDRLPADVRRRIGELVEPYSVEKRNAAAANSKSESPA